MSYDEAAVERAAEVIYAGMGTLVTGISRHWRELTPHGQQPWLDMARAALEAAFQPAGKIIRIPHLGKTNRRKGPNDE